MYNLKKIGLILGGALILCTGCSTVGLGHVPSTRENYNIALNHSDNEQFLMNMVRMHYNKTPFFLGVDSVVIQTSLNYFTAMGDSWIGNSATGLGPAFQLLPQITFTQSPTITYTPMQGTSYISGLLAPVDLTKLYYLVQTNLDLATVLKMTINQVGPISNVDSFMSNVEADNQAFNNFADTLSKAVNDGNAHLYLTSYAGDTGIGIYISDPVVARQISTQLGLSRTQDKIVLSQNVNNLAKPANVVKMTTRSFFSVLNFLATSIVPATQKASGDSTQPAAERQDKVFTMYVSSSEPKATTNKVEYGGKWYYVLNADIHSKVTLMLLKILFSLQSGDVSTNAWGVADTPAAN